MPKAFTDCVKNGGNVVTEKRGNNKFQRICYDKEGNRFAGEVKTKKKTNSQRRRARARNKKVKESRNLVEELKKLQKHFKENYHN